jgi:hypothetical protein
LAWYDYTYILSSYFLVIICYHHSHIINVINVVGKPKAMTQNHLFFYGWDFNHPQMVGLWHWVSHLILMYSCITV